MSIPHFDPPTHLRIDLDRIEAYNIRNAVSIDGILGLRKPDGSLDATSVAIETSLRDGVGLPHWIRELDAPTEFRNPAPWAYCTDPACPACATARRYNLPPLIPAPRWIRALAAWLVARIDAVTTYLASRRAGGRP